GIGDYEGTAAITYTIAKLSGTGSISVSGWTYDAAQNTPDISNPNDVDYTIEYKLKSSGVWLTFDEAFPVLNAGLYDIRVIFEETINRSVFTATSVFTVNKADIIMSGVKFEDKAFKYDGNSHSISATGLPSGVEAVYSNNGKTEKGTYTVTVRFESTDSNYNDPALELSADLVINHNGILPGAPGYYDEDGGFPYWIIGVAAGALFLLLLLLILLKKRSKNEEDKKVKGKVGSGDVEGYGISYKRSEDDVSIEKTFIVKNQEKKKK
ncbi:MAG: hypothetical protein FWG51_03570, partial [Firmicutes bacterium]|nr:hypothetical protein [Bacillota bacterium]